MTFRLFEELAHRYDAHTPPHHYEDDHRFVLALAKDAGANRLLDVGCGTGVFLERAREAGLQIAGLDAARGMIDAATKRLGGAAHHRRMQDIDEVATYDVIASLSWTLNYAADANEMTDILARCHRALAPGGLLVAQVAHASNASGQLFEDHELGPGGDGDISFFYRFRADPAATDVLVADYTYVCRSANELAFETHFLRMADANAVAEVAARAGFRDVELFESHRREPFGASVSPWLVARR